MSLNAATALSSFSSAVVLASEKSIAAVGDDNVDDFFNPPYPLFKLCSIARGRCVDADGLWCTVLWCVGLRGEDTGMRKDLDSPKDSPIELLLPLPYSRGASATTAAVTTRRSASESMLGDGPGRGTRARSHAGLDSHSSVVRAGDAGGSIATCTIMIDFNLTGKILGAPYYSALSVESLPLIYISGRDKKPRGRAIRTNTEKFCRKMENTVILSTVFRVLPKIQDFGFF
jgi:hypothetical protein